MRLKQSKYFNLFKINEKPKIDNDNKKFQIKQYKSIDILLLNRYFDIVFYKEYSYDATINILVMWRQLCEESTLIHLLLSKRNRAINPKII